jgi:hypothetical protein
MDQVDDFLEAPCVCTRGVRKRPGRVVNVYGRRGIHAWCTDCGRTSRHPITVNGKAPVLR